MKTKITVDARAYIVLSCYLLLMPLVWVLSALTAMVIHELGHCAAIWACGGEIYEVHIGPFGARIDTHPMDHRKNMVCALAGPLAGLLLVLFLRWIPAIAVCALMQTVFNLLPIYPFDGGRAVRAVVGMVRDKSVAKKCISVYNDFD